MLILALDTATKTASVALAQGNKPLGEITLHSGQTHSVNLLPALDNLLSLTGVKISEIEALAFAKGPGSFTGLRIGGALITGLAQPNNLPVYCVSTLDALAMNGVGYKGVVAPILDARKNEVYSAFYRFEGILPVKIGEEMAIPPQEFVKLFSKPQEVMLVGDAVERYKTFWHENGFFLPPDYKLLPQAANIAFLAYEMYKRGEKPLTYREIKPNYLRASEAEVKLRSKKEQT